MEYTKPQKLSVLLEKDEEEFATKVNGMVQKSYDDYAPFRDKCKNNELVWRNRHWTEKVAKDATDASKPRPNVPVLHSTVENCTADIMDSMPDAVIRGVGNDDDIKALIVTELTRFIFQRANYETKFEKKVRAALKRGEGAIQPFWNPDLTNGMGDIDFEYLNINNYAWDKGVDDVNDGRFFAKINWVQPEELYDAYPALDLNECEPEGDETKPINPDLTEDIKLTNESGEVKVITFMWKERKPRTIQIDDGKGGKKDEQAGRTTYLNTAVIIGRKVVFKTLDQYEYDRFFVNILTDIAIEGEPVGLSEIDLHKDDADTVNMIQKEYLSNLQASAEERFLVDRTASIDEKELLDYRLKIIHGNRIHEGAVRPFKPVQFSGQALNFQQSVIAGMKERSGQADFNIGGSTGGITSGVGVQRMQAYGAKRSRLRLNRVNADHKNTVKDVLKLAQEHYDIARVIRISREAQDQIEQLVKKAQQAIQQAQQSAAAQQQQGIDNSRENVLATLLPEGVSLVGNEMTIDFSIFSIKNLDLDNDIEIVPQRKNAATSDAINGIVAAFANNGGIAPDLALELSEYPGKEQIIKKIRERNDINAKLQEAMQQAQQAMEQTKAYGEMVQQQAKQIELLKQDVWAEKLKELAKDIQSLKGAEGEGNGEQLPQTADEAKQRLQALASEIQGSQQQGAA